MTPSLLPHSPFSTSTLVHIGALRFPAGRQADDHWITAGGRTSTYNDRHLASAADAWNWSFSLNGVACCFSCFLNYEIPQKCTNTRFSLQSPVVPCLLHCPLQCRLARKIKVLFSVSETYVHAPSPMHINGAYQRSSLPYPSRGKVRPHGTRLGITSNSVTACSQDQPD